MPANTCCLSIAFFCSVVHAAPAGAGEMYENNVYDFPGHFQHPNYAFDPSALPPFVDQSPGVPSQTPVRASTGTMNSPSELPAFDRPVVMVDTLMLAAAGPPGSDMTNFSDVPYSYFAGMWPAVKALADAGQEPVCMTSPLALLGCFMPDNQKMVDYYKDGAEAGCSMFVFLNPNWHFTFVAGTFLTAGGDSWLELPDTYGKPAMLLGIPLSSIDGGGPPGPLMMSFLMGTARLVNPQVHDMNCISCNVARHTGERFVWGVFCFLNSIACLLALGTLIQYAKRLASVQVEVTLILILELGSRLVTALYFGFGPCFYGLTNAYFNTQPARWIITGLITTGSLTSTVLMGSFYLTVVVKSKFLLPLRVLMPLLAFVIGLITFLLPLNALLGDVKALISQGGLPMFDAVNKGWDLGIFMDTFCLFLFCLCLGTFGFKLFSAAAKSGSEALKKVIKAKLLFVVPQIVGLIIMLITGVYIKVTDVGPSCADSTSDCFIPPTGYKYDTLKMQAMLVWVDNTLRYGVVGLIGLLQVVEARRSAAPSSSSSSTSSNTTTT